MGYFSVTHVLPEHKPKPAAAESVFDGMKMSDQILREQGFQLFCLQFRF